MRTTGIRGSSIPTRNVCCATVVQSPPQIPGGPPFIDAVTDIADAHHSGLDHGLSSLSPNCPSLTTCWDRWPSPVLMALSSCGRGHATVTASCASCARIPPGGARECVHASTPPLWLPLKCECAPLSRRPRPAPICMQRKSLDMETTPPSCTDERKCHLW